MSKQLPPGFYELLGIETSTPSREGRNNAAHAAALDGALTKVNGGTRRRTRLTSYGDRAGRRRLRGKVEHRGRLNLIAHLLDHVPDCRLKASPLELPPLAGKPRRERYTGPVKPIRARY